MRVARIRTTEAVVPAVAVSDDWYDLTSLVPDLDPTTLAPAAQERIRAALAAGALPAVEPPTRYAPPLTGIGKIVCVGLNYRDHAEETGLPEPQEPVLFLKAPDTVVGPDDEVLVPRRSVKTDYEVELAVVIGQRASYLDSPDDALAHVAGYAISNDVSEREFQNERGGQWDKGKNCPTFNPFGPWIVTADAVPEPQALGLRLRVNGELRQDGNTKNMIFGVAHVIWYVSQFMTLHPGDVVNTGTPAGVALGRPDHPYLRAGDVVEVEIDGLGRQRQVVGQA
jgi:2-keto-4-pentenoate hydratase/2-oxohepta-3-ene-1,7-dioic acid hydratase in catechol pathway